MENSVKHVFKSPDATHPYQYMCLIPFISTIYGIPEISLHFLNSPLSASFKFSVTFPFLNQSFSLGQITSSPLHSIVMC